MARSLSAGAFDAILKNTQTKSKKTQREGKAVMRLHENVQQTWPGARFGVLVLRGFAPQPGAGEAFARRAEAELEALRARHRDYDRKRFCRGEGGRPKKIFSNGGKRESISPVPSYFK